MATLADMKARIASEIARSDLTTQIANAINDAITMYQKERFRFSEPTLIGSPTFSTVAGRSTYTTADNANISTLYHIDFLTYVQGNSVFDITRRTPKQIKLSNQNGNVSGPPDEFTYEGNAISLYPVPDAAYVVSIDGHLNIAAPASDIEADNVWMNAAEMLIRCRAKYEIAKHVTRNQQMATDMSPDNGETMRAWKALKMEMNLVKASGKVAAMQF